jgi:uncharacterized membrane protein YsdA (DUF1294 family)
MVPLTWQRPSEGTEGRAMRLRHKTRHREFSFAISDKLIFATILLLLRFIT